MLITERTLQKPQMERSLLYGLMLLTMYGPGLMGAGVAVLMNLKIGLLENVNSA